MSKSIWAHVPILTPERKLWRAVLEQAYADAEMTAIVDEAGPEPSESWRARQYLRADNFEQAEHLKLVCDFADVPADRVILLARGRYAAEPSLEKRVECGSAAAAFPEAEPSERSADEPSEKSAELSVMEKRELCSHTPQDAAPPQAAAPA